MLILVLVVGQGACSRECNFETPDPPHIYKVRRQSLVQHSAESDLGEFPQED